MNEYVFGQAGSIPVVLSICLGMSCFTTAQAYAVFAIPVSCSSCAKRNFASEKTVSTSSSKKL